MPWTSPATAASQGNTGYLTQFLLGVLASPPTYTAVVNVRSLTVSEFGSVPNVDVSTLLSPDNTQELFGGMAKPGTIDVEGVFTGDTTQTNLYEWLTGLATATPTGPTLVNWQIKAPLKQYNNTYYAVGIGFVSKFSVSPFEIDKSIDFKATIQITGPVFEGVDTLPVDPI